MNMNGLGPVRLAQPSESLAVGACVREAYAPYVGRIGREPAPMQADYAELIGHGLVYIVLDSGGVCGVLVLRQDQQILWIDNVAVHPGYQKRGLGRRLMAFAEQRARTQGISELRLYTNELMFENIALYQRLGYAEFERREHEGFRRVFMRKPILKTTGEPALHAALLALGMGVIWAAVSRFRRVHPSDIW